MYKLLIMLSYCSTVPCFVASTCRFIFGCYMTLALSKIPIWISIQGTHFTARAPREVELLIRNQYWLCFCSGSCLDSSRERLVPDQQSWETSMAVQEHTNTRTHKHYNPTIIHTQRGNKCCFSTFQSVFFTIYMLPTRDTHICFTNKNGLKQTNKQTDNKTKEKTKKCAGIQLFFNLCEDSHLRGRIYPIEHSVVY